MVKLGSVAKPLAALALAAILVALVLLVLGASPVSVFAALGAGAFGNWFALTDTIVKATPLVFAGLAIAVAFQGALWNIGADGQLLVGALAAGAIGPHLGAWPRPLAILLMLAAGAIGGALWGGICGWLRARRDVNEVISTIMMNFVAVELLSWAVHGPLIEASGAYPTSATVAPSAKLYMFFPPSRLNAGMILAIALAIACYLLLFHTEAGFELRALGRNRRTSAFFGIPIAALTVWAMALSGALAGLGGAVQVSAITHRLYERFSPGWGYEAIAVALVARLNPAGVLLTSLLFGALDNGSQAMQRMQGVSPVLVQVIQGLVILILLAFDTSAFARLRDSIAAPVETAAAEKGAT
jgi:general nucleoside transport system permease protein